MGIRFTSLIGLLICSFFLFGQKDSTNTKLYQRAELGAGFGVNYFQGEVAHTGFPITDLMNNYSAHFYLRKPLGKQFGLDYVFDYSHLSVIPTQGDFASYPFQSTLLTQRLQLSYSMRHLFYRDNFNPFFYPVLHVGAGFSTFKSYGDLDSNGVFDNELRQMNNDGLGEYVPAFIQFPVTLDLKFRIHNELHLTLFGTYHLLQTDLVDDISDAGLDMRSGDAAFDNMMSAGVRLTYDFGSTTQEAKKERKRKKEQKKKRKEAKKALRESKKEEKNNPKEPIVKKEEASTEEPIVEEEAVEEVLEETAEKVTATKIAPKEEVKEEMVSIFVGSYTKGVPVNKMNYLIGVRGISSSESNGVVSFKANNWKRSEAENEVQRLKGLGFIDAKIMDDSSIASQPQLGSSFKESSIATEAPIVETVNMEGVHFKIQLAAFANGADRSKFKNVEELSIKSFDNGVERVYSGDFTNYQSALKHSTKMDELGYKGAFVVAFRNEEIISLSSLDLGPSREYKEIPTKKVEGDLIYKVQLGLYSSDVPMSDLQKFVKISDMNQDVTPDGVTRYTAGAFKTYVEALEKQKEVIAQDVKDAFVIALYKGKRISIAEARKLE